MTIFTTVSGGGAGVQIAPAANENVIVNDGVTVYSDDNSVLSGPGGSDIFLGENSSLISFANSTSNPTIKMGTSAAPVSDTTINIAETASVIASGSAIVTYGQLSDIINRGLISGDFIGVDMNEGSNNFINFGDVTGTDSIGVRVWQNADISNFGNIYGGAWGVVTRDGGGTVYNSGVVAGDTAVYLGASGVSGTKSTVNNTGELIGNRFGIYSTSESTYIVNSGVISSTTEFDGTIRHVNVSVDDIYNLDNTGTIQSIGIAYQSGDAIDEIRNSGLMSGDIEVGGGDDRIENSGSVLGDILLGDDVDVYRGDGDSSVSGGIYGGLGEDRMFGGQNADTMYGNEDADKMRGRAGDDALYGGAGEDDIKGNDGDDVIQGNQNNDVLRGGRGDDEIFGGSGNDVITGGSGNDILSGNSGVDTFVFTQNSGNDVITDFKNNTDKLDLSAFAVSTRQDLTDAGAIVQNGAGSIIDLTQIGGDGVILVDDMSVAQWGNSDFVFA